MSFEEIVKQTGDYRVVLVADEYAEEPYGDCQNPVMRIERGWHATHVAGEQYTDTDCVEAAVRKWGSPSGAWYTDCVEAAVHKRGLPSGGEWYKVVMYLKAFFGATDVAAWYSGDYWYVSYDTTAFREETGATGQDMTAWKAYVEGDVWGFNVEKRVTWHRMNEGGNPVASIDTWELVDDVEGGGGYYGYDSVVQEATRVFTEFLAGKDTYEPKAGDEVVFTQARSKWKRETHYTVTNVQDNMIATYGTEFGEAFDYTITTEQAREMGMRKAK